MGAGRGAGGAGGAAAAADAGGTARVITGVSALLMVSGTGVGMRAPGVNSSGELPSRAIARTPPHTAQRARTEAPGMRDGSMRKTERQSGQETFTGNLAIRRP